jgi:type IV secretion system protein VirB4
MTTLKDFFKLGAAQTGKAKVAAKEVPASEFVPYKCHWNSNTILTKKNELMQVIRVAGFSFETADDSDVDIKKNMLNMLIKGLSTGSYTLYFHTIRRRTNIFADDLPEIDPNVKLTQTFADYVNQEWSKKYSRKKAFVNELYVTVVKQADSKGAAILEYMYKKFIASADKAAWEQDMKESFEELEETTNRIMGALRDYSPELLGVKYTENGAYCEIVEFVAKILNCGAAMPMLAPITTTIDKYIPLQRLIFGSKSLEVRGPASTRFAALVSFREYGPTTNAGILDSFLQMPFELVISQSFSFTNRQVAINKMQLQQNRMIQAEDKAVSQIAEISQALDLAMSGDIAFGDHHITILVTAPEPKALENIVSTVTTEVLNAGIIPVREKINLEPAFWGQLPGNGEFIIRKSNINSLNLSGFAAMHNFPLGKARDNHWGDSVTVFDTTSGTPYHFNFHIRDVGHSLIIGPTGAGKTVLMNFLCAMAQKFKCRMFFFDKDRGAEIFIRAIGGKYTIINPGEGCGFNPLQLPDTGENRTFLLDWLKLLVTVNGESLSSDDIFKLTDAIAGNFKLEQQDRVLHNIVPFLGIEGSGSLASRIAMWHSKGSHAKVFDNMTDSIDLTTHRIFGFEMAPLLRDTICLSSVLLYIFHRINISLDGTRTMIVLDEAWALIDNPVFAPKIKDWLKVLRKLNTFVIFATQSVEDASKSAISDTLIQQTATQIFLPNLKATNVYRTAFMLSQREYVLIKTTDPSSRYFLIKQGVHAVVARIDLSGMTDIINVLSGRTETVLLLDQIRKEVGEDPLVWLPIFYERAKNI